MWHRCETPFAKPAGLAYLQRMVAPLDPGSDLPIAGVPQDADPARPYPVMDWSPTRCGHSAMRIDAQGRWFHEEREIRRPELVSLFARLLRREPDGRHVLVTPVEMLDIEVEDAPLFAVEMASDGDGQARTLQFRIGATGQWVTADGAHPLGMEENAAGPRPALGLEAGLRARLIRPVYYALADLAIAEGHDPLGLWSGGVFHALETTA
ncbi:DUF1285 domain-containing protein [Sphingobium sp. B11D3D]|uniref:DUF1285 domain-containing protein n=1 Tax=Sphingobium sp. B11D3D TaxID=2940576 RepID=UPI002225958E|nr:DUF1285 domain-containing protein [Sphingobium sp. B11D3D]MCW2367822.1 hypothetical protein [Sphingobium sp. B11D3D]